MNETFSGCLRKFKSHSKDLGQPVRRFGTSKCSDKVEDGAFFYGSGGYIMLGELLNHAVLVVFLIYYRNVVRKSCISVEKFTVGKEMEITMDIKPRSIDGILMSVQTSKKNLLILEMKNGTMSFTVDLGKGPISASFTPASPYFLCDGLWHSIKG